MGRRHNPDPIKADRGRRKKKKYNGKLRTLEREEIATGDYDDIPDDRKHCHTAALWDYGERLR